MLTKHNKLVDSRSCTAKISSKSLPVGFTGLKKCAKTHKVGAILVIFSMQMASLDHHGYLRCTVTYLRVRKLV